MPAAPSYLYASAACIGLLVSEDNALPLGSLLLFGLVALVMIFTRKVDWYAQTAELAQLHPPSPPRPGASGSEPLR